MCTMSMVHDHYSQQFNRFWQDTSATPSDLATLRQLIDEFKQAVAAAKTVDVLTKQPDCVDPEKAKLQEQVARLEKMVDALLAEKAKP